MRVSSRALVAVAMGSVLFFSGCSDGALDPTVVIDHEPIEAQPWTATGELVDAGQVCPSGDRQNVSLAYLDGTPMSPEELGGLIDAAEAAGGSHWDVPRMGGMEYVCNDGSGTFTLHEMLGEDSRLRMTGEITSGTGAYASMTGSCVIDYTEDEGGNDITEMIGTCEFDVGSVE